MLKSFNSRKFVLSSWDDNSWSKAKKKCDNVKMFIRGIKLRNKSSTIFYDDWINQNDALDGWYEWINQKWCIII